MVAEYILQSRTDARDYRRRVLRICEETRRAGGTGWPIEAPRERRLERAKGFEPSTPTLARSCSTPELHPHPVVLAGKGPAAKAVRIAITGPAWQHPLPRKVNAFCGAGAVPAPASAGSGYRSRGCQRGWSGRWIPASDR